ncbi:FAD-binding and (Fe-S)-binding domain-containing protein [Plantactinospora sp. BB1]|uniref:FAD-binding and (Fe-S)-binding domain-containing protein n=1 Tax=Plantactinospora sp. BB1 TaxID=2071627 RepID=UPI000D172B2D|nr:FAD-binding and (Fe-S)-binding domain-containing protein [Plantactinospora sp. BB1]AVT36040.1 FAD-binding oxidoreductase [Plantactinospora sp. BB1]
MSTVSLPDPVTRAPGSGHVDLGRLAAELRATVDGEVRFDAGSRAAYSTDASNYRQIPLGVVVPRTVEAAVETVAVCRRFGAPVLSRGGGTSLAGQSSNVAVVLDWSKYCSRLLDVDAERRTCLVEPGIVRDTLNERLAPLGLEFGPEPATHDHCTVGGMIGNNSCGASAQRTGKVVDNVVELEVLLYDGTRMWVGATDDDRYAGIQRGGGRPAEVYRQLRALRDEYADEIRRRYPDIPRRVSGYNLDSLLPERGFHVAQALVGAEGTLVTILRARLRLVPVVRARSLVLLGYPDIAAAADDVPRVLPFQPIALEGVDDKLIDFEKRKQLHPAALHLVPPAGGWLMAQFGADSQPEADEAAARFAEAMRRPGGPSVRRFVDPAHEAQLWAVRESGLGATAFVAGMPDTWPGWEDSAVAPDRLGDYLRELRTLYREYDLDQASIYGHFGQGCLHNRLPFPLTTADGIARFRSFLERAASLVVSYGGSLSGEHGDGQGRAELLPVMFGDRLVRAFGQLKAIFDPDDRMNPGKVVAPLPLDSTLRIGPDYRHGDVDTVFGYPDDGGSFGRAVLRCVGVGKCRRQHGGVMCPSYQVTREEKHSTRGRARLLFEMLDGTARGGPVGAGWRSEEVRDALDLCLACKGCKSDCPLNVDMATYKAEFLSHHYAGRLRPRAHYSMGWLPLAAALAARAPRLVNAVFRLPGATPLVNAVGGIDRRRELPLFADQTFQRWFRARRPGGTGSRGEVLLWPDTFSNHFSPAVGQAAVEVLEAAGWRVRVPEQALCCGLTWISTGQLHTARRVLRRSVEILRPYLRAGTLVVGLEPSCTAVFRSDAAELFPDDEDVATLRRQTVTLAELLHEHTPDWRPPTLPAQALVQTHCHQHAVLGTAADRAVLAGAGIAATFLDSGCCGLAGNFGFEQGHYDVSVACAERVLLPAVRAADPDVAVLADGFSCRTQIEQGAANGRRAVHLAELLRAGLRGERPLPRPERRWAARPRPPASPVRALVGAAVGMAGTAALAAVLSALAGARRRP